MNEKIKVNKLNYIENDINKNEWDIINKYK